MNKKKKHEGACKPLHSYAKLRSPGKGSTLSRLHLKPHAINSKRLSKGIRDDPKDLLQNPSNFPRLVEGRYYEDDEGWRKQFHSFTVERPMVNGTDSAYVALCY